MNKYKNLHVQYTCSDQKKIFRQEKNISLEK